MTRSWQGFTPNQVVRRLGIIGPLRILILYNNFWTFCSLPWLIFGCFWVSLLILNVFLHFWILLIWIFLFCIFWCLTFPLEYIISYGCPSLSSIYHLLWMSFFHKIFLDIFSQYFEWLCLHLNDLLLEWSYLCIFTFCNFEFLIGYFSLITIFLNGWTESSSWLTLPLFHIFEFSRIHSLISEWFVRVVNDSLYTFLDFLIINLSLSLLRYF